jgi:N5-hydroxyornithine acetyltransferase
MTTGRMPAQQVILPHGQTYTIAPVFGGYTFKSTNLDLHHAAMPPGWTVVLQTEDEVDHVDENLRRKSKISVIRENPDDEVPGRATITHRFTKPTIQSDSMFISSISMPASSDFKGPTSPTRHIALMVWATLYWYFHKDPPKPQTLTEASSLTPESGRPKAEWRIKIKRQGILKGKNTLQKLERMGLISSEDSCVGTDTDIRLPSGWSETFVSQRAFWQIDAKIFLFTLAQVSQSPFPTQSPFPSRPASPERGDQSRPPPRPADYVQTTTGMLPDGLSAGISSPGGPFNSGSHLPTYYPPPPTQFTFTNHIRHPIRPKPPRQGEVFYTRYIPSLDSWLSFRIPSLSPKPVPHPHFGPVGGSMPATTGIGGASIATLPTLANFTERQSDLDLLHKWMNDTRVNTAWGVAGPMTTQTRFLEESLSSRHSFPVYGCFDGKPFGYFEIYWVKEDKLGRLLGGEVGNYTRGLHVLVGEDEFRGPHRVKAWLSALVHYCWLADMRTNQVLLEPRVDNTKQVEPCRATDQC